MVDELVKQLREYEKTAIDFFLQASRMKEKIMEEYGLDKEILKDIEIVQIPFAAYETQLERFQEEKKELLDRHDAEKDKMRKHYSRIILAICIPFILFITLTFGSLIWFFNNYDVMSFEQLLTTGNYSDSIIEDGIHYNSES